MLVPRLYYWKGLEASVNKHIKHGMKCQKRNIQVLKYAQLHFSTPRLPMQLISMDLIGPFDPSSNGQQYPDSDIYINKVYILHPLEDKDC